jgi:hypothetical protein
MITRPKHPGDDHDESSGTAAVLGKQSDVARYPTERELEIEQSNNESAEHHADLSEAVDFKATKRRELAAQAAGARPGRTDHPEDGATENARCDHGRLLTEVCGMCLASEDRPIPPLDTRGAWNQLKAEPTTLRPDTPPVALFPHETLLAAQREAGPLNAVARGTDGLYRALTVPRKEWTDMSVGDQAGWCAAHGFDLDDESQCPFCASVLTAGGVTPPKAPRKPGQAYGAYAVFCDYCGFCGPYVSDEWSSSGIERAWTLYRGAIRSAKGRWREMT